ncbi:MAG: Flp family type IVb pilin [Thermaurantiacus sp.]
MQTLNMLEKAHLKVLETKAVLGKLATDKSGASAAEYALILALIAVFIIGALEFLGGRISSTLNAVGNKMPS